MTRLKYPLICFDLDGTLVDDTIYIWNTLHDGFSTNKEKRKQAYDDFFAGRITYRQWFEHDLKLLAEAGATKSFIHKLLDKMQPMPGAVTLLKKLGKRGHKIAIISGSLDIVVTHMFPNFAFDHVLINTIEFNPDGTINGGNPTEYDLQGKAKGLKKLCQKEGISTAQAAFVGDNINDIWIAQEAGFSIAFNCKSDKLAEVCNVEVKKEDLLTVYDLMS